MAAHVLIQKSEEKISSLLFCVILYTIWNTTFLSELKLSKWAKDNQDFYFQAVYFLRKRYNPFQNTNIWVILPWSLLAVSIL